MERNERPSPGSGTETLLHTPRGVVRVRSRCSPDFIETLDMDEGIGVFARYRSIIRSKHTLSRMARANNANVVLAYSEEGRIVGYLVISDPDPNDRWGKGASPSVLQLHVLEVSRDWRGTNVARSLMKVALDDESYEQKIIISTEYSWHWDLDGSGLTKQQYRDRLLKLLKEFGFRLFPTNEPNILLDPANMLTARVGCQVSDEDYSDFSCLLFGVPARWAKPIE